MTRVGLSCSVTVAVLCFQAAVHTMMKSLVRDDIPEKKLVLREGRPTIWVFLIRFKTLPLDDMISWYVYYTVDELYCWL